MVTIKTRGYKPDGTTVIEFERTFMTRMRGAVWKGKKVLDREGSPV